MAQLRVLPTVWQAYRSVGINLPRLALVATIPLGLMFVAEVFRILLPAGFGDVIGAGLPEHRLTWASILWTTLRLAPYEIAIALFLVPCYRLFLFGHRNTERNGFEEKISIYRNMIVFVFVLHVIFYVPFLTIDSLVVRAKPPLLEMADVIYPICYLMALVGISFAFPVISLGRPLDLEDRLDEVVGNYWRFFAALCIALLPLGVLAVWLNLVVFGLSLQIDGGPDGQALKELVLQLPFTIAMETLWAAITVVAFARLTGYSAKGVRVPSEPS